MMKFYFQKKVLLGFFVAMSIITWLGVSAYKNNRKFKETSRWVAYANEVLYHAEQILTIVVDIESGQRGYAITRDKAFLEPYFSGEAAIRRHLRHLQALTADHDLQQRRVVHLAELIEAKLGDARSVIEVHAESMDAAKSSTATVYGNNLVDDIRKLILEFQEEEKKLLKQRAILNEHDIQRFNDTFIALLVATGTILALVFVSIYRNLRARVKTDQSLRQALERIKDMYDKAPCGYHSVDASGFFEEMNQTWLRWLGYDKNEVIGKMQFSDILAPESVGRFEEYYSIFRKHGFVNDAEFRILRKDGSIFPVILNATAIYDDTGNFLKSRSTVFDYTERKHAEEKILQLNDELEAFTYSVSHDLRAPLRAIDGYSRILEEDYKASLDSEGTRILQTIIRNANRMGKLIDDLLDFSRIGRKEIVKAKYNMDILVHSVFEELTEMEKDRIIECNIHHVASVISDPTLLRQVWCNLISNALKYSRKKDKTCVEITSQREAKEVIYRIRDNGTGFDMQYAHKLFHVFQRLHRPQDFEGTGVGLAIVHRVISRHGGRVWAEGKMNEGAVFYFSLPHEQTVNV
jgi:PAS domain S-box-containing protein